MTPLQEMKLMAEAGERARLSLTAERDALAAQRDEGLAREAELAKDVAGWKAMALVAMEGKDELRFAGEALHQRLAEAEKRIAHLEQGLKFYADGDHLLLSDADAWDTCSGEPINFLHDDAGTASVEDGSIAKQCLASPGCADGEKS